jgi:molecular chaperone DnaJ
MAKNYYDILGVNKSANQEEIKKAFRKLAHEHHPDKKTGDNDKFKEINEAYQVLGNPEKRSQYDQFGQTFKGAGSNGGGGASGNPFGGGFGGFNRGGYSQGNVNFDFEDLGDIFGSFFGGSQSRKTDYGRDLEMELEIEFTEAVFGVEKNIDLRKNVLCDNCRGSGDDPQGKVETCKTCGGSGKTVRMQQTILGNFQVAGVCSSCKGKGRKAEKQCDKCRGKGYFSGTEKIKVTIPSGIDNGQSIRLSGKGEFGEGGRAGDLYIKIKVRPNKNFVRSDDNIKSTIHINLKQAILGDKIDIETVDGPVALKIPEGTQSQTQFKLKDKGVPHLREYGRGDHLVEVIVDIPKGLSRKDRKVIEDINF